MAYPNDYTPIYQYNHHVILPHDTYDEWRAATLGYGFDVDGQFGNQCWDYIDNLYYQYDLTLVTRKGGGTAADCWNISRNINSQPPFEAVVGKENIKRGDVIVIGASALSSTGHICIADQDYEVTSDGKIWCLGQNQGHGSSAPVTRDRVSLTYFLGIFRNTNWQGTPPTPPTPTEDSKKKRKFPFIIAWKHWGYRH